MVGGNGRLVDGRLDLPSQTSLSVAGCVRLHRVAAHWATSLLSTLLVKHFKIIKMTAGPHISKSFSGKSTNKIYHHN